MRKLLVVTIGVVVMLACNVSICAAQWVLYRQVGNESAYYNTNFFYRHDKVGETPFIGLMLKVEQRGKVTLLIGCDVDPSIKTFRTVCDLIKQKDTPGISVPFSEVQGGFRIVEAIQEWQKKHPRNNQSARR